MLANLEDSLISSVFWSIGFVYPRDVGLVTRQGAVIVAPILLRHLAPQALPLQRRGEGGRVKMAQVIPLEWSLEG